MNGGIGIRPLGSTATRDKKMYRIESLVPAEATGHLKADQGSHAMAEKGKGLIEIGKQCLNDSLHQGN